MPSKLDWGTVVSGVVVGAILAGGSIFFYFGQKTATMEAQIEAIKNRPLEHPTTESFVPSPQSKQMPADPKQLVVIIKIQQEKEVRESSGIYAGQNFSDADFEKFEKNKVPKLVTDKLKKDSQFIDVILALKQMEPTPRQNLLNEGLQTYKKTWGELGRISKEGQTEAGQKAEKMIAKAIIDLAKELYLLSPEKLDELRK